MIYQYRCFVFQDEYAAEVNYLRLNDRGSRGERLKGSVMVWTELSPTL
jgi:hypothetical protein